MLGLTTKGKSRARPSGLYRGVSEIIELVPQLDLRARAAELDRRNVTIAVLRIGDHGRHVELLVSDLRLHCSGEGLAILHVGEDGVAILNLHRVFSRS